MNIYKSGVARRTMLLAGVCGLVSFVTPAFAEPITNWTSEAVPLPRRRELEKAPIVTAIALRSDGQRFAIGGDDHSIRIWDQQGSRFAIELLGHTDWVRSLSFSGDGSQLASSGNDGRLIVWDVASGRKLQERTLPNSVTQILFDHSGNRIATVGYREPLRMFASETCVETDQLSCPCVDMRALAISSDNRYLAGGGRNGKMRIWDVATGSVAYDFAAHRQRIRAIEFSPDARRIASGGEDRVIRVADIDGRDEFKLAGAPAKIMSLTFCGPDQLASGGSDNMIRIWDLETRAEVDLLAGHTGSVMALAYRADTLVSAGYDTTVRVWRRNRNVAGESRSVLNR